MAEISPPEVRGSLMALEQLSIVVGCVLGFWTGFVTRDGSCFRMTSDPPSSPRYFAVATTMSWRIPLFIQIVPAVILLLGAIFKAILPPSPRLLVIQGRHEEAAAVLRTLRGDESVLTQVAPTRNPTSTVRNFNHVTPLTSWSCWKCVPKYS